MPKKHALCRDEELLQMLEARAKTRGQELEEGSPGRANAQFDIMVKLSCELLRRGHSARQKILSLLNNSDPYVDVSKGEAVLEEIARNYTKGLGFSAQFTLEQWRKGELRTLSQWACKDSG